MITVTDFIVYDNCAFVKCFIDRIIANSAENGVISALLECILIWKIEVAFYQTGTVQYFVQFNCFSLKISKG